MARFRFSAIDSEGRARSGSVEAMSTEEAEGKIAGMGLKVKQVIPEETRPREEKPRKTAGPAAGNGTGLAGGAGGSKAPLGAAGGSKAPMAAGGSKAPMAAGGKRKGGWSGLGGGMTAEGIALFTRQLATLLRSGLPLVRAVEVLIRQERKAGFRESLQTVADTVKSGGTFSDGLKQFPKLFNSLYLNMVRAGEAGGILDTVLDRLAGFQEKSVRTAKKVQSALVYPVMVMSVAAAIVGALMVFVVPSFEKIFGEILDGAPLPGPTLVVIAISNLIKNNFLVAILGMGALVVGFNQLKKVGAVARQLDALALLTPGLGELTSKSAVARFARTTGTLLEAGVPILQGLTIARDVAGNRVFAEAIQRIHDRVRDGEAVAAQMGREKVFPILMTSMVEVGEETGALPDMLVRVADSYDEDVDNAVGALTSIIEPAMIVFLALVVGFIVIALFLPIIEVIRSGFGG